MSKQRATLLRSIILITVIPHKSGAFLRLHKTLYKSWTLTYSNERKQGLSDKKYRQKLCFFSLRIFKQRSRLAFSFHPLMFWPGIYENMLVGWNNCTLKLQMNLNIYKSPPICLWCTALRLQSALPLNTELSNSKHFIPSELNKSTQTCGRSNENRLI